MSVLPDGLSLTLSSIANIEFRDARAGAGQYLYLVRIMEDQRLSEELSELLKVDRSND